MEWDERGKAIKRKEAKPGINISLFLSLVQKLTHSPFPFPLSFLSNEKEKEKENISLLLQSAREEERKISSDQVSKIKSLLGDQIRALEVEIEEKRREIESVGDEARKEKRR